MIEVGLTIIEGFRKIEERTKLFRKNGKEIHGHI
jgi:hypothetical protein